MPGTERGRAQSVRGGRFTSGAAPGMLGRRKRLEWRYAYIMKTE